MKFLNEQLLSEYLALAFPNSTIIRDKPLTKHKLRTRPDFVIDDKIIVEFDGDRHFAFASVIVHDKKKDKTYSDLGYEVIRIPYFIQLDEVMEKYYFGKHNIAKVDLKSFYGGEIYPHGFIDKNAMLPADWCTLGCIRYENIMEEIPSKIKFSIIDSLDDKLKSGLSSFEVLPCSFNRDDTYFSIKSL